MIVRSKATEVSVYRNSVSVTRTGSAALQAGRSTIFIQGMSKTAKSDSFSIKFPTEIHAVNIQVVNYEETKEDPESEKIAKELSDLNYNVETYSMMIELRKKNGDFSSRQDVSVEDQEKYLESLPKKLSDLHEIINKLTEEKEKISKKLKEAEEEEEKPLIMVELECEKETFILSLGQDERLNVIRKELPCKTSDVFLKGQKKKSHEYAIKITNKSSESIKVLLKDSIPVSTDKTITVDATELSSGVVNEENGVINWDISVAGHSSEEIKLAYTITWPKDKQISRTTDLV